jgi:hypothetical protein
MTFSLAGKQRPNKPSAQLLDAIQGAVTKALGPGYSVNVYSGQENPGHRHGSNRHGTGLAADVHIIGPDGKTLNARENRDQMLAVAAAFKELGGMGVGLGTDYMGGTGIHLDMVEPGPGQDNAWGNIGNAKQSWLDSLFKGPIQRALPAVMDIPRSLAQVTAIEQAYKDPARALDVVPSRPAIMPSRPISTAPPSNLNAAPVGQVTRSPLGPALPSYSAVRPSAPSVGSMPAAPAPAPSRLGYDTMNAVRPAGPVGSMPAAPTRSLAHPVSAPKPSSLAPAPVGQVERGPALAPAGPSTAKQAEAYGQYAASRMAADETAQLANQYAQYQRMPAAPPVPAKPLAHPVSVPPAPVAPPAIVTPPAQVLAPALVPNYVRPAPMPSALPAAPPAPPAATAYDVYSGLATQAKDNTGRNTVGMLPDGTTTVTNQWGVTTGMTPYGKQTAVGSLPGISGPTASKIGGALPGIAGSMLGGYLGGPVGAIAGGLLGRALAPGGILSGTRNIDTSMIPGFGPVTAFARPDRSLNSFPSAPSGGIRSANFSNRSRGEMNSISPRAAADIEAGRGGLF